jgi:hypothetical protein
VVFVGAIETLSCKKMPSGLIDDSLRRPCAAKLAPPSAITYRDLRRRRRRGCNPLPCRVPRRRDHAGPRSRCRAKDRSRGGQFRSRRRRRYPSDRGYLLAWSPRPPGTEGAGYRQDRAIIGRHPTPWGWGRDEMGIKPGATAQAREAGRRACAALAEARAAALAPIISEIRASGITSPFLIAAALTARRIPTARGHRVWRDGPVRKLLSRLDRMATAGSASTHAAEESRAGTHHSHDDQ